MTDAQKLQALIQKAIKDGWSKGRDWTLMQDIKESESQGPIHFSYWGFIDAYDEKEFWVDLSAFDVLFDHDFARALFGDAKYEEVLHEPPRAGAAWEYYLQIAVISDDPIDYMYKAVFL